LLEINMKKKRKQKNKGVVLLGALLIMSLILFLSIYFLNLSVSENKISESQTLGMKTYYLAEAGINHMVWKLKNDAAYRDNFKTNPTWTQSFTVNNPFGAGSGSYTVSITNTAVGDGNIESTGTININGNTGQRVIKTKVFKAIGESPVGNNGAYADGNIDISYSKVNFNNGDAHSNLNFIVNGNGTIVNAAQDIDVVNNYNQNDSVTVNVAGAIHSKDYPPAAAYVDMPAIDFDSASPNSYKSRATAIYTENQFENLLKNNQNLTLDGIIYVTGEVEIKGARNITINGVLVADEEIEVGDSNCWRGKCGKNNITVNHTAGQPSGLISKEKVEFESYTGNINISGIVYSTDKLDINGLSSSNTFTVNGGLVGRKLTITSGWGQVTVNLDNAINVDALGEADSSPIITVEHWEEEY